MQLPERIAASWITSLPDAELLAVESQLHEVFLVAEDEERQRRGDAYELARGSAELMLAWQRWSVVSVAARSRGLLTHYRAPASRRAH